LYASLKQLNGAAQRDHCTVGPMNLRQIGNSRAKAFAISAPLRMPPEMSDNGALGYAYQFLQRFTSGRIAPVWATPQFDKHFRVAAAALHASLAPRHRLLRSLPGIFVIRPRAPPSHDGFSQPGISRSSWILISSAGPVQSGGSARRPLIDPRRQCRIRASVR